MHIHSTNTVEYFKKQFDESRFIEVDELPSALETNGVVLKDTIGEELVDHDVLTGDSELNEYFVIKDFEKNSGNILFDYMKHNPIGVKVSI